MGRPVKNDRRNIVNAILFVATTGCRWRALPDRYPNWNTVHHYHLTWVRDGTWERVAVRLGRRRTTTTTAEVRASVVGLSSTFSRTERNAGPYRSDPAPAADCVPSRREASATGGFPSS